MIDIVTLCLEHLKGIERVEKYCFCAPWTYSALKEELENSAAVYLTALNKANGEVVGYAGMWLMVDMANITRVAVHPDYRRKGVARRMLEKLAVIARQRKMEGITLEVRASNISAQALYSALGFAVLGQRKGYYPDREDAVIMTRMFEKEDEADADTRN